MLVFKKKQKNCIMFIMLRKCTVCRPLVVGSHTLTLTAANAAQTLWL